MVEPSGYTADDARLLRDAAQVAASILPCRDAAQAKVAESEQEPQWSNLDSVLTLLMHVESQRWMQNIWLWTTMKGCCSSQSGRAERTRVCCHASIQSTKALVV